MCVCMCSKDEETYLEEMFLIFIPLALKLFAAILLIPTHYPQSKNTLGEAGILSSVKQCCGN